MFGSIFGKKKQRFASPFTGELRSITETPDEAFAEKMNGDGFMVSPSDGVVLAPADSVVNFVFETKHALGLTTTEGLEYLLHVGIDTVNLQGKYFTPEVKAGDKVKKGDLLLTFDLDAVKAAGYDTVIPVIVTNTDGFEKIELAKSGTGKVGDTFLQLA